MALSALLRLSAQPAQVEDGSAVKGLSVAALDWRNAFCSHQTTALRIEARRAETCFARLGSREPDPPSGNAQNLRAKNFKITPNLLPKIHQQNPT